MVIIFVQLYIYGEATIVPLPRNTILAFISKLLMAIYLDGDFAIIRIVGSQICMGNTNIGCN